MKTSTILLIGGGAVLGLALWRKYHLGQQQKPANGNHTGPQNNGSNPNSGFGYITGLENDFNAGKGLFSGLSGFFSGSGKPSTGATGGSRPTTGDGPGSDIAWNGGGSTDDYNPADEYD